MSITYDFTKQINGNTVAFHGTANDAGEALTSIAVLMADVVAAVATKTTTAAAAKNSAAAKTESAALSTDARTPTASDNSANSSKDTLAADTNSQTVDTVALDYDKDVKPLVLEISKTSRDNATALLQRHGAIDPASGKPSAKALKPSQYPKFVADAQAVIAGTLDPLASSDGEMA
jgi:hypothetical protein